MRNWLNSTPVKIFGSASAIIGLVGIPDDLLKWIQWLSSMSQIATDIFNLIDGNTGRWIFTIFGILILFVSFDLPQTFYNRIKFKKAPPRGEKEEQPVYSQTEKEKVDSLLRAIQNDFWLDRLFRDLIFGHKTETYQKSPSIVSVWRPGEDGDFYYIGKNEKPTEDEEKEKIALAWLVLKGLAKPAQDATTDETGHWYFIEKRGISKKVEEKFKEEEGRRVFPHKGNK